MSYRAPVSEYQFLLQQILGYEQITATERFAEADNDLMAAILTEAGKMCDEVMAPLQRGGDLEPARLENGVLRTSPGFGDGYKAIAEGGWIGMSADPEYGGMGLPMSLTTSVNEMMSGACLSLQLAPLMSQGQIEALEHHASDALKDLYLPKLISGEWAGTMNLTEPQAGSDVGALSSKAEDNGDGTYAVSGQKIYISWGDNDFTENVCHLVLARLPDGAPGTKGISLFLVPKYLPDENGNPGKASSLKVVSLEHKMGLHGSPTCVMQYDGATGWLVGKEHGGMAAMFTMMNNARLGVGGQGVGAAEGAYQHALGYALDRKQGKTPVEGGTGTIVDHADVRRMLMEMKADVYASRAIMLACAGAIDMGTATGDAEWKTRAAFLTPIAKAFGTETGIRVSEQGVQVHGGMGFIEETGAAQFYRDVRVTAIYEGTNGIQAMDLVARKMMDGGEMAHRLIDEIEEQAERARPTHPNMAEAVWQACETLREATEWLVEADMQDRFAGAVPYLMAFARVLGGHYHLAAALADKGGAREKLARFYIKRMLPQHAAYLIHAREGAAGAFALRRRAGKLMVSVADVAPRTPWEEPPAQGEAIEVAEGVLWMRLPLPMKLDHVNVYAFDEGDSWTVVDTGMSSNKTRRIWEQLMAGPLGGKPVRRVVVTHHHPDHIGNAGWFQSEHGAELVTTRTAWLFARMLTLDVQEQWPAETLAYYRSAGMDPETYETRKADRPFNFADTVYPMPLGFTRVQQGDVFRMGGRDWDVHMGNGHAPEHATFWSRNDNLVLTGDQVLSSISPNIGVYATEPEADPLAEWLEACERLAALARPEHLALGGHKLPFTRLPLRMRQLIDNHHGALERLMEFLEAPKSAAECFSVLFKRTIGPGEYGLALVEAVAHVNHLYRTGQVSRTRRDDEAWVYQRR